MNLKKEVIWMYQDGGLSLALSPLIRGDNQIMYRAVLMFCTTCRTKHHPSKSMEDCRRFWHFRINPFDSAWRCWFIRNYIGGLDPYFLEIRTHCLACKKLTSSSRMKWIKSEMSKSSAIFHWLQWLMFCAHIFMVLVMICALMVLIAQNITDKVCNSQQRKWWTI